MRQLLLRVDRVVADVVGHATARGGGPRGDPWAGVRGSRGGAAGRHAGDAKGMPKRRRIGRREILLSVLFFDVCNEVAVWEERNEIAFWLCCFLRGFVWFFSCFGFWFEKV